MDEEMINPEDFDEEAAVLLREVAKLADGKNIMVISSVFLAVLASGISAIVDNATDARDEARRFGLALGDAAEDVFRLRIN